MHNPRHLTWLLEGVESWNRRRHEEDFRPNLEGVDINKAFGGFTLGSRSRVPLGEVDLSGAILKGANLSYGNLEGANLALADLSGANLTWCNIDDAHMPGAVLKNTKLYSSSLTNTNWACTDPWESVLFEPLDSLRKRMRKMPRMSGLARSVGSVGALVAQCRRLTQHYAEHPTKTTLYFRGESDATWEMRPTVMRGDISPQLRIKEGVMLVDLMSRQPEVFDTETLAFSQLVRAQHHGLTTRLLDISRNPAFALFCACGGFSGRFGNKSSKKKKRRLPSNGRVHVFAVQQELIKPFNSDTISLICNFAKLSFEEQLALLGDKVAGLSGPLDHRRSMARLYHFVRQEKPNFEERINPIDFFKVFVAEPQQRFARIRAQAGAFLVSAFHERLEQSAVLSMNPGIPIYDHYTLDVPRRKWPVILEELEMLNLRVETLLPSLDESARAVVQAHA